MTREPAAAVAPAALGTIERPARPFELSPRWVVDRFRRIDDGAWPSLETSLRFLRFAWRCTWHRRAILRLEADLVACGFAALLRQDPRLSLRPLRAYLSHALDAQARADAIATHCRWLAASVRPHVVASLFAGQRQPLFEDVGEDDGGETIAISLARPARFAREGELALELAIGGELVATLAFVAVSEPGFAAGAPAARFVVGALQGAPGALDGLRRVSARLDRLQPAALLVVALQALGEAASFTAPPRAVSSAGHVYRRYRTSRREVSLDYDRAWSAAGGTRDGADFWILPARWPVKPIDEVPSKHRSAHRRKERRRAAVHDAVRDAARALLA